MLRRDALTSADQSDADQAQRSASKLEDAKAEAARMLQESRP